MSDKPINILEKIARLKEERDRLRQKLVSIETDYRKGLSPDSEDRAVDLENADVLAGIARVIAEELEKVEESLSELQSNQ